MSQEVVMVLGYPASGKGELAEKYIAKGYTHLNRDKEGGQVKSLLPKMEAELAAGHSVVLDNLFASVEDRAPFIAAAKAARVPSLDKPGVPIRCEWMQTSVTEATINSLNRMWERHKQLFLTAADIKAHPEAKKDPNIFPIAVIFHYRKVFEKISGDEGFQSVKKIPFVRRPWCAGRFDLPYSNKAAIFDYDETLRTVVDGNFKFPTDRKEVKLLPNRIGKLRELKEQGYILLGVSNQSGIARNQVGEITVRGCFEQTNKLLGQDIHFTYCPHNIPPTCYCRKPQSGLGVQLIHQFQLDPAKCFFVGDQTTDKTWAKRLGIPYHDQADFF